ncbi:MAG TPA: sigma 54-interacting transcriptional regulator [Polyangiaceae bacterium LLY-WYZ-15_(1-7)]|nr:hypothetical protein [Myxococcales bacterium]MAT23654.1 hypothetical protein [Sandaracinus sp.]HJL02146.1 sigma 54-interacting transcriptional regulator [Polyangiaceae bacterium LLY-WYZ-15_(1-7)]HJL13358.1 sigma 54-interacting transcriptional regulator [Polyangiaceae bacterium LLY-WYZ-15_(1-7)]HJL24192.1 sigma 54-interacting transcriptional regulator [Polyangiaceae bacterium LLY-WYZ-15_(1-7)]
MVSETVARALTLLGANPFDGPADALREAVARLVRMPRARLVMEPLERGAVVEAERNLLAIGHAEVLAAQATPDHGAERVLAFPERIWSRLPRERSAYLRICRAAGRGFAALDGLVGSSEAMAEVRRGTWAACFGDSLHGALVLEKVIVDHDVLVLGETGTGKEAVAQAIQEALPGGADGGPAPRAALNAGAVPETLIESELFGHVKGAFTGATTERKGRIRSAKGGCFFLDEVGDIPETTQVKLLRVMETNVVQPLGADQGFVADVRYVAATHKDLDAMVEAGAFRRDLFQRLAGHVITLPPLRDRRADIPELGRWFVRRYMSPESAPAVWERVESWLARAATRLYAWPGNVRELQNLLRSVMLGFEPEIDEAPPPPSPELPSQFVECTATLRELDEWYLARVLRQVENNYAAAARILGVDRATIRRRAKRLKRKK